MSHPFSHIHQIPDIEAKIREVLERRRAMDFLSLADVVAVNTRAPVQLVERVIRMLLQERVLAQDSEFKIVLRKQDGSGRKRHQHR